MSRCGWSSTAFVPRKSALTKVVVTATVIILLLDGEGRLPQDEAFGDLIRATIVKKNGKTD
jgi:hypothetical protein